jgi:hypothetical protein
MPIIVIVAVGFVALAALGAILGDRNVQTGVANQIPQPR